MQYLIEWKKLVTYDSYVNGLSIIGKFKTN